MSSPITNDRIWDSRLAAYFSVYDPAEIIIREVKDRETRTGPVRTQYDMPEEEIREIERFYGCKVRRTPPAPVVVDEEPKKSRSFFGKRGRR
jgi:hypothetical protein